MKGKAIQHHGSWIGREFLSFSQVAPFIFAYTQNCFSIMQIDLIIVISSIIKIVYHYPSHIDIESVGYIVDRLVIDYLHISKLHFASIHKNIFHKFKPHVIRHMGLHIRMYARLSNLATERQEGMNGPLRKTRHQVKQSHS